MLITFVVPPVVKVPEPLVTLILGVPRLTGNINVALLILKLPREVARFVPKLNVLLVSVRELGLENTLDAADISSVAPLTAMKALLLMEPAPVNLSVPPFTI